MKMNYSYPPTMYEFLVENHYLHFYLIFVVVDLTRSIRHNYCLNSNIPFIHCSKNSSQCECKHVSACHNDANGIKPGNTSKLADKHAAEYSSMHLTGLIRVL